jgi:hypothetical protein
MSEPEQTPENSTDNWYPSFFTDAPPDYGANITNKTRQLKKDYGSFRAKIGHGTTGRYNRGGGKRKTQRRNKNNKKTRKHKQKSKSKGKAKKSRKTKA